MPEHTDESSVLPLTWHEAPVELALPPYDSSDIATIVDAWAPQESA